MTAGRVAHDALVDPGTAELELRLDHRQDLAAGRQAAGDGGQHLGQRDEGDVDGRQVRPEGQVRRGERAGVDPLDHGHARILAHAQVDLAVGDVERGHARGAALQQAVGEATGRCARVEAFASRHVDAKGLDRVVELDSAARDEARRLLESKIRLRVDELAGPERNRPIRADTDLARADRAGGGRARRKEAPLGQNRVYSGPGAGLRHAGTVQPSIRQSIRSPCQMFSDTLELGRTIVPTHGPGAKIALCDSPHTQIARMFVS